MLNGGGQKLDSKLDTIESSLESQIYSHLIQDKDSINNLIALSANPRFYIDNPIGKEIFIFYRQNLIEPIKSLWNDKVVIVIEGFNSYFGVYNDLLDNARRIERINNIPSFNAFKIIDRNLQDSLALAKQYNKDEVCFILSLGASAKILCIYLLEYGYNAYDMGNCSISYDCSLYAKDRKLIDTLNTRSKYILLQ